MADPLSARHPLPPFTAETAQQKVKSAEAAWNTRDSEMISEAYSLDSEWRNRGEFLKGRTCIVAFLRRKWEKELDYKLVKYLWAYTDNRISVCFEYEYHDSPGQWFRAYGNENWEFDDLGYMRKRIASINESPISADERRIALDDKTLPVHNAWLVEQGLSDELGKSEFPLANGSAPSY